MPAFVMKRQTKMIVFLCYSMSNVFKGKIVAPNHTVTSMNSIKHKYLIDYTIFSMFEPSYFNLIIENLCNIIGWLQCIRIDQVSYIKETFENKFQIILSFFINK